MPAPDRDSILQSLRDWLRSANPNYATCEIDADTDIIESRILESLQLVELILFLEKKTGRAILVEDLNPAKLRTLNNIYNNFFEHCR
jgi:acyl carrier protein